MIKRNRVGTVEFKNGIYTLLSDGMLLITKEGKPHFSSVHINDPESQVPQEVIESFKGNK